MVGDGDAGADGDRLGDADADADRLGDADADGDWDVCTDGDADPLANGDVLWNDDAAALAEEDAFREADGEADTAGALRPAGVDAAAEEVSPAGDWPGVGVFPPVSVVTANPPRPPRSCRR